MNSPAVITIPCFNGATLISASSQGIFKSGSTRSCSNIPNGSVSSVQNFSYGQWKSWTQRPIPGDRLMTMKRRSTLPIRRAAIESPSGNLTARWREIHGANDWQGLLDPMDDILRKEIVRYGEFAQACYDGFDFDPYSKYCGSCKYNRRKLFEGVGMSDYGYEVTRYLYATSNINLPGFFRKPRATAQKLWSSHANWMGFIAVAQDENEIERLGRRDIVIAWRGTVTYLEWIADLMDILKPAGLNAAHPHPEIKVESGFLNLYTAHEKDCRFSKSSARDQVLAELKRLIEKYKGQELSITITGHSLGSALAMLSAYDIAEMGLNRSTTNYRSDDKQSQIPITVFSFAGPRVGNSAFKNRCEELGLKFLRIVNVHDGVPKVPGVFFNEKFKFWKEMIDKLPWSYCHVGVELALDHTLSPFLKPTNDLSCFHNLEAHLHLVDGYHGRGQRFYLSSGRDPALVNKACDFLKDHHLVPPFWRQDANRGLVKNSEGRWVQPERQRIDEPHPDQLNSHSAGDEINSSANGHPQSSLHI
eukprot:Gb_36266 [translate_table: standard]